MANPNLGDVDAIYCNHFIITNQMYFEATSPRYNTSGMCQTFALQTTYKQGETDQLRRHKKGKGDGHAYTYLGTLGISAECRESRRTLTLFTSILPALASTIHALKGQRP